MTAPAETVVLRYGLRAHYITHQQIAAQRRAQGRKTKRDDDAQPQVELEADQP